MATTLSSLLGNGFRGALGYTGSQGAGFTGSSGFTGSQGDVGFTGSEGAGFTGSSGFTGSQGDVGFTGSEGAGFTGSSGFTGSQGDVGFTGSEGAGFTGSSGFTGSQGDVGFTGSQGDVGFTGSQGDVGFTGSQGDVGFTGSQGDIGYTGSAPIESINGYTGSVFLTSNDLSTTGSNLGNITSTATIDCDNGEVFTATVTGNVTLTFSNPNTYDEFALHLTNGGDYTITWPASVDWPGGVAPTLTAQVAGSPPTDSVDVLVFVTADGGTTWRGAMAIGDVK